MALTRKYLKALGLTDEQVESIIDAHGETVEALKGERDAAKAEAEKVAGLQKQLDDATLKLAGAGDAAKVQAEFDAYKASVIAEKENASKAEAVKAALKAAGVQREEFIGLLARQIDLGSLQVADGKITDTTQIDALKNAYPACFGSINTQGVQSPNPPAGKPVDTDLMTDAEYYAYMAQNKK